MPWDESKDSGKQAFSEGKYRDALTFYSEAIRQLLLTSDEQEGSNSSSSSSHTHEHQVLLSNAIACRLKIGGQDMAQKAVEEAKKCVALNNQWSKAHVRLASAYIAMGGHSNDACLSLQRALSLDRNNKVAREMLVKEMRQRNNRERTGESGSSREGSQEERNGSSSSASQSNNDAQHHPTEETPHRSFPSPSAPPQPSQSTNNSDNDGIDVDDIDPPDAYYSLTFSQRIQHHFAQFITWFYSQSDDIQTLLKVAVCFLILYVALGGRFGLDYALGGDKSIGRQGNYGEGNAYDKYSSASSSPQNRYSSSSDQYQDRYGNEKQQQTGNSHGAYDQQRQTSGGYNDRTNSQNDRHYSRYENDRDYNPPRRQRSTSYQMPNLYDGSLASMAILLVIGIVCHRFGINPFQAMWMLNQCKGAEGITEWADLAMGHIKEGAVVLEGEDLDLDGEVGVGTFDHTPK
eukprot:CAMPEP_0172312982 /NCGR_PEP_ID=MMETSP1058-20130122/19000_1 /TAXON_ID=83371 /ORGANISM="Detonula confervacea, Strain CCMP 353" /LENGTH=459 /DNA_ID=CAMNT_0013026551 /DNA_START=93 /DNA_END=1473 /DNA_ORIENTATION=+